jgi:predicted O-linked N-acetylglucosamine transferase (SPINDLY family)
MISEAGPLSYEQVLELAASGKLGLFQVISAAETQIALQNQQGAVTLYRAWLRKPDPAMEYAAYFNLGVLLADIGCQSEAEAAYRQAVWLKRDFPQANYNLGVQLEKQGRFQAAIDQWKTSLNQPSLQSAEQSATHKMFLNGLGRLHDKFSQYADSEEMLRRSLEIDPGQTDALYHWLHIRQKQCKWPIMRPLPNITNEMMWNAASPLAILGLTDDPTRLLQTANSFIAKNVRPATRLVAKGHQYRHARIKIGFVSGDFCLHAVSLLTVRLFELLDRARFEVFAFGWSRNDDTPFRQRVVNAFEHFIDISEISDEAAAAAIMEREIDIVVDLQGLTAGARPNIVAQGPAPHQIAYLGYPGASAIPYVDYVIADKFIFPSELKAHFTEEPIFLSDCFQVSDDTRTQAVIDDPEKYSLPSGKFIYCAFNNNYKITPEMFESWMRVMRRVPDSILWLLRDNEWAEANMLSAAQAHGVDPGRLYFAGRVSPDDYLARFGTADLFLDTFPYNAGTTANDALWAGLPIITLSGRSYVSRMAGSLLCSAGLPELIANTITEYEDKAVAFAADHALQLRCKEKLRQAKTNSAAMNTQKFVAEFSAMAEQLVRGQREERKVAAQ